MLNNELFANRLQELMDYYEISASGLADSIGIQRSSISHLLSGRNNPSLDFVLKVLDNYPKIGFDWFVKGIGSLESSPSPKDENSITPTLFEQESSISASNKDVENKQSNIFKEKDRTKILDKVLLLYTDGSFDIYNE